MVLSCHENLNITENTNPDTLIRIIANDLDYSSDDERTRDMMFYVSAGFDMTHDGARHCLELAKHPPNKLLCATL
jgi:hypothetical protein